VKLSSWFGIIILYTVLTSLFAYFIPEDSFFALLSYVFGFIFVSIVPGYCFISLLFREGKLDLIEKAVLSVALSFSLVGVTGLFLGLSPIGITKSSIIISISIIVIVFAFLAFLRRKKLRQLHMQSPEQVGT
jgi:uncharacterized membrane protein